MGVNYFLESGYITTPLLRMTDYLARISALRGSLSLLRDEQLVNILNIFSPGNYAMD